MKVYIGEGGRGDHVNLDPAHVNLLDLSGHVAEGEASEISALDVIDRMTPSRVGPAVAHLATRLGRGGTLSIGGIDMGEVARKVASRQLTIPEAALVLFGDQTSPAECRRGAYSLPLACDLLRAAGLEVVTKRRSGMVYCVTICRACVFAESEGDAATERGCTLGIIEKFEERGALVEGWDDGTKKYLRVVGRVCPYNHQESSPILKGVPPSEWAAKAREHAALKASYIVYAGPGAGRGEIEHSVASAAAQSPAPARVIIILDGAPVSVPKAAMIASSAGCPFEIVAMEDWVSQEEEDGYNGDRRSRAIDAAVAKIDDKRGYYAVLDAGLEYPFDFAALLDAAVNDEMRAVAGVAGEGFLAVMLALHHHPLIIGNLSTPISEKFGYAAEQANGAIEFLSLEDLRCTSP